MLTQASEFRTPLHKIPVAIKLIALIAATILLLMINNSWTQFTILLAIAAVYLAFGKAFFKAGLRAIKPVWFFIVIILAWNLWRGELGSGVITILRLINAIALANLFSMTSRLDDILALVTQWLKPLQIIGVNPKAIAMAIALTLRFIPVLRIKANQLDQSWRTRSKKRARWQIVTPITLVAIDDASQIADALRARGGITSSKE